MTTQDDITKLRELTSCGSKEPPTNPQVETPCNTWNCINNFINGHLFPHTHISYVCTYCLKDSNQLSGSEEKKGLRDTKEQQCPNKRCINNPANHYTDITHTCGTCEFKEQQDMRDQEQDCPFDAGTNAIYSTCYNWDCSRNHQSTSKTLCLGCSALQVTHPKAIKGISMIRDQKQNDTNPETPQYQHDCDECTFLGRHVVQDSRVDTYACHKTILGDATIILRHSSEPAAYWSMPTDVMQTQRKGNGTSSPWFHLAVKLMDSLIHQAESKTIEQPMVANDELVAQETKEEEQQLSDHELYNVINNKLTEILKCMQDKANIPAPSCHQWNCRGNSQAAALFPHIADLNYCSECCNKQSQALADLIEPPGVPKWTPADDIAYSKQWNEEEQLLRDQTKKLKQAIAMGIGDMRVQLIAGPGINLEIDAAVNDKLSQVMEMVTNGDFDYYMDIIREQTNAKH